MIVLKKEYAGVVIGFKNSAKPLGLRSQAELVWLYEKAKAKNIQSWLSFFDLEEEPTQEEIEHVKVESFFKKQEQKEQKRKKSKQ